MKMAGFQISLLPAAIEVAFRGIKGRHLCFVEDFGRNHRREARVNSKQVRSCHLLNRKSLLRLVFGQIVAMVIAPRLLKF